MEREKKPTRSLIAQHVLGFNIFSPLYTLTHYDHARRTNGRASLFQYRYQRRFRAINDQKRLPSILVLMEPAMPCCDVSSITDREKR